MPYEILETDFSIFKSKEKAIQLLSENDKKTALLLFYQTANIVMVGTVGVKDKICANLNYHGRNYIPFVIDFDSIKLYKRILKPYVKIDVPKIECLEFNEDKSRKITRDELKYFDYKSVDVPQDLLLTYFHQKKMPHKYLAELDFISGEPFLKEKIPYIKSFYQLLNEYGLETYVTIGGAEMTWQESIDLYHKCLENYPELKQFLEDMKNDTLSPKQVDFLYSLAQTLIEIYRK